MGHIELPVKINMLLLRYGPRKFGLSTNLEHPVAVVDRGREQQEIPREGRDEVDGEPALQVAGGDGPWLHHDLGGLEDAKTVLHLALAL